MESGWSESWDQLMDDMNLLLAGGDGAIHAVVILKWQLNRRMRLVSGFVELYVRDRNGMPVHRQREVCPKPLVSLVDSLTAVRMFSPSPLKPQPPNGLN